MSQTKMQEVQEVQVNIKEEGKKSKKVQLGAKLERYMTSNYYFINLLIKENVLSEDAIEDARKLAGLYLPIDEQMKMYNTIDEEEMVQTRKMMRKTIADNVRRLAKLADAESGIKKDKKPRKKTVKKVEAEVVEAEVVVQAEAKEAELEVEKVVVKEEVKPILVKGRPKKEKKVVAVETTQDLFANLMQEAMANNNPTPVPSVPSVPSVPEPVTVAVAVVDSDSESKVSSDGKKKTVPKKEKKEKVSDEEKEAVKLAKAQQKAEEKEAVKLAKAQQKAEEKEAAKLLKAEKKPVNAKKTTTASSTPASTVPKPVPVPVPAVVELKKDNELELEPLSESDEDDEDDEDDEEELKVVKFEINGKTYLKDTNSSALYDLKTQEPVGSWNEVKKTIDALPEDESEEEEEEE
jgi:hypothetical protein